MLSRCGARRLERGGERSSVGESDVADERRKRRRRKRKRGIGPEYEYLE